MLTPREKTFTKMCIVVFHKGSQESEVFCKLDMTLERSIILQDTW